MLNFAIDFGNGFVKAKSERRSIVAPSVIARKDVLGFGSLDNVASFTKNNYDYHVYKTNLDDSAEYIWGADIEEITEDVITTGQDEHRYESQAFKMMCEFVLSELSSDYTEEELNENGIMLVTGMPSQEIGSKEEQVFKSFLEQKHLVERDGVQSVIDVSLVKVVEQPIGSLLDVYMNENGQLYKSLEGKTITVIDFGAGTTIIDTYKNLKLLPNKSDTIYRGINDIYKDIESELKKEYAVKRKIVSNIKEGFHDGTLSAKTEKRTIPFEKVGQERIDAFVQYIVSELGGILGSLDAIDSIIITGGGLNVVGNTFKKKATSIISGLDVKDTKDSQNGNLRGFYKLSSVLAK